MGAWSQEMDACLRRMANERFDHCCRYHRLPYFHGTSVIYKMNRRADRADRFYPNRSHWVNLLFRVAEYKKAAEYYSRRSYVQYSRTHRLPRRIVKAIRRRYPAGGDYIDLSTNVGRKYGHCYPDSKGWDPFDCNMKRIKKKSK